MSITIPNVNVKQTTIRPYDKSKFEFFSLFINISPNINNGVEKFFKYSQINTIERNLDNSIKTFFDNGGSHLYLLNYNSDNFDIRTFEDFTKKSCDGLVEIETISTPTLLSTSGLDIDHCIRVMSFLGEYANLTDRIYVMDVNKKIIEDYLDMLHEGVIYYPWFKNKKGELVSSSSVATALMSSIAMQNKFFHSIANKQINSFTRLEFELDKKHIEDLKSDFINPILFMHNDGLKIWGVDAFNSKFKTINEVRVIKYIKRNLKLLMRDNLFEVNSPKLRDKVFSKVNNLLLKLFEMGALHGETQTEAYMVESRLEKGDDSKLVFYIGIALSKPLEFINIKLECVEKDGIVQNISLEA